MPYYWICDVCGQPILKPEEGWVEWTKAHVSETQWVVTQMRLVHKSASPDGALSGCRFDLATECKKGLGICDRPMTDYIGPDGLMSMLEHAADPEFKLIDVMGLIKRLQVPGYDQAKAYFDRAIPEGVIELTQPKGYYCQREIQAVIDHYEL